MLQHHDDQEHLGFNQHQPLDQEDSANNPPHRAEKPSPPPNSNILQYALIGLLALLLYTISTRIAIAADRSSSMNDLILNAQDSLGKIQTMTKEFKQHQTVPFTREQHNRYSRIISNIKKMEQKVEVLNGPSQENKEEEVSKGTAKTIEAVEELVDERTAVIKTLMAHAMEEDRKWKLEMIESVAKKGDFEQEKVRNPWLLGQLNLRSPFMDTLQKRHMEQQVLKEAERLQKDYQLSRWQDQQLPICVVVPTRNNAKKYRYHHNLHSILNQDYQNYKLVIVDDASTDRTADLIQMTLKHSALPDERWTLIRNKKRMTAIPNINKAIREHCPVDGIAVVVSGDDQLLGRLVFKLLNAVYHTKKPGVAYTNHFFGDLHNKDFNKGYSSAYPFAEIKNKLYRYNGQRFGHMRTFLVRLFLQIKQEHMKYPNSEWVQATWDQTFLIPLLEMACDSIEYIDQYVYLYNYGTGDNDGEVHHDTQAQAAQYVRQLPKYNCIPQFQRYPI